MNKMKTSKLSFVLLFTSIFTGAICSGQKTNTTTEKDAITGDWKGPSICQVKNSPCHDEMAMYHISKTGKENVYRVVGNKIVNGQEEEMGILEYNFDPANHSFTCIYKETSVWKFTITGDSMHGTLTSNNVLYRIIDLKKQN
jgi:hypothetical protein